MEEQNNAQACALCDADACLLDFGKPCCTARYIARLKSLEQRRGWLDRFRRRKDAAFMAQVEARLAQIWKGREKSEVSGKN